MTNCFQLKNLESCIETFKPTSCHTFILFHLNIRSIRKHWDEFQLAIISILPIADIFVLTEINIHRDEVGKFTLPGFKRVFYTRENKRGGGIAIFIKNKISFTELRLTFNSAESIVLHIITSAYDLYLLTFL